MFKVAIIGGEKTGNYEIFKTKCIKLLKNKAKEGITIISSGDTYVDQFGKRYNITVKTVYTNWKRDGNNALKVRNETILNDCEAIIIFNDGTKDINIIYEMAKNKNLSIRNITLK